MENKPLDCGRCNLDDCVVCQTINKEIESNMKHFCNDDCKCLCVLQRPMNKLGDVNLLSSEFKIGCGDVILRKVIGQLRKTEEDRIKERIAYKAMEDKQNNKITKLEKEVAAIKLNLNAIIQQLAFKGIQIKLP